MVTIFNNNKHTSSKTYLTIQNEKDIASLDLLSLPKISLKLQCSEGRKKYTFSPFTYKKQGVFLLFNTTNNYPIAFGTSTRCLHEQICKVLRRYKGKDFNYIAIIVTNEKLISKIKRKVADLTHEVPLTSAYERVMEYFKNRKPVPVWEVIDFFDYFTTEPRSSRHRKRVLTNISSLKGRCGVYLIAEREKNSFGDYEIVYVGKGTTASKEKWRGLYVQIVRHFTKNTHKYQPKANYFYKKETHDYQIGVIEIQPHHIEGKTSLNQHIVAIEKKLIEQLVPRGNSAWKPVVAGHNEWFDEGPRWSPPGLVFNEVSLPEAPF